MKQPQQDVREEKELRVRRGRVESVDLYEIKDSELEQLEKGSPADLQLNFAIFLISIAFASLGSLVTATFPNDTVKTIFVVIAVVGFIGGAYLLLAWNKNHTSQKDICKRIRERIPAEVAVLMAEPVNGTAMDSEQPETPKG